MSQWNGMHQSADPESTDIPENGELIDFRWGMAVSLTKAGLCCLDPPHLHLFSWSTDDDLAELGP